MLETRAIGEARRVERRCRGVCFTAQGKRRSAWTEGRSVCGGRSQVTWSTGRRIRPPGWRRRGPRWRRLRRETIQPHCGLIQASSSNLFLDLMYAACTRTRWAVRPFCPKLQDPFLEADSRVAGLRDNIFTLWDLVVRHRTHHSAFGPPSAQLSMSARAWVRLRWIMFLSTRR